MSLSVRSRRIITCACIAASLACLILAAPSPAVTVPAVVSIAGAVLYLHSTMTAVAHMSTADRQAWGSARTLGDLGELTARWLEGSVASVPGYCGRPDEETEALVPVLARLNRAGFVTDCSQPGEIDGEYDCEQRAAVQGYASPELAARLYGAAVDADMIVVTCAPDEVLRWRYGYKPSVAVTQVNGRHFTGFGVRIPRRHIRDPHIGHGMCGREAVDALCSAWQVTFIDPEWGRNDVLWPVLDEAVRPGGAR